jgi:hypothetical protein
MLMKNLSKLKHAPEHSQIKKMSVTNVVRNSGQPANFASNCSFLARYFSMNKKILQFIDATMSSSQICFDSPFVLNIAEKLLAER